MEITFIKYLIKILESNIKENKKELERYKSLYTNNLKSKEVKQDYIDKSIKIQGFMEMAENIVNTIKNIKTESDINDFVQNVIKTIKIRKKYENIV